jgi:hypothetical protein
MEALSFNGVINSVGCNLIPLNSFVNVHICELKYVNFVHLKVSFLDYWESSVVCEISSSHGGEYEAQNLLMLTDVSEVCAASIIRAMEAARTSETSVNIQLRARQYIPDDSQLHLFIYLSKA